MVVLVLCEQYCMTFHLYRRSFACLWFNSKVFLVQSHSSRYYGMSWYIDDVIPYYLFIFDWYYSMQLCRASSIWLSLKATKIYPLDDIRIQLHVLCWNKWTRVSKGKFISELKSKFKCKHDSKCKYKYKYKHNCIFFVATHLILPICQQRQTHIKIKVKLQIQIQMQTRIQMQIQIQIKFLGFPCRNPSD